MPIEMRHERDNVYRIDIRGMLRKAELDRCGLELASEIDRVGSVRLLFFLTEFRGWEAHAGWSDMSFFVEHGAEIERIAIVGELRWRAEALLFAAADLRRAPVKFFPIGTARDARIWLSA